MQRLIIFTQRILLNGPYKPGGFLMLFVSKNLIHGAATALLGVFVPIFLYTVMEERFEYVGAFYALASFFFILFLIPGVRIMCRKGFRLSLVLGGVSSVFVYILLYFMNEENVWMLIAPLLIAVVLFRIFHWVPYHVDFTIFTKSGERGRDVSFTFATVAFLGVIGPLLAGYILTHSGYNVLFGIAIGLLIMATISYMFVPNTFEVYEWSYIETWRQFFKPERRNFVLGLIASGMEVVVTLFAWPIFLFELLDGNVFEIGAVSALVVGVTILVQIAIGHHIDKNKRNKHETLRFGSLFYAFGWVIKMFVLSAFHVFFVGLYHNVTRIFMKTPFDTILYDMTADQGNYIDEFTVLKELAMHVGRIMGLILIILLMLVFSISIQWTFIIAAGATLLLNLIYRTTTS